MFDDLTLSFKIAVIDDNAYTQERLIGGLARSGFGRTVAYATMPHEFLPQLLIFNIQANDTDAEVRLRYFKRKHPNAMLVVLCAPGKMMTAMQLLFEQEGIPEYILAKPLKPGTLSEVVKKAFLLHEENQNLAAQNQRLSSNLTNDALCAIAQEQNAGRIEQRAILFTDVRGSSALLEQLSVAHFFAEINRFLVAQSACVRQNSGELIKFTGDGMMVTFSGFGHAYRAVRCARQIQQMECASGPCGMRFGIGLAEGLVMCGFVGDLVRRQYDVLGANVNLAARLCGQAEPGQILLPESMWQRTGLNNIPRRMLGALPVRGFSKPVASVALDFN